MKKTSTGTYTNNNNSDKKFQLYAGYDYFVVEFSLDDARVNVKDIEQTEVPFPHFRDGEQTQLTYRVTFPGYNQAIMFHHDDMYIVKVTIPAKKSVGERQAETGNQVDTDEEQPTDNAPSGPALQPNIIALTLGGRIVGEIELTDDDSRFKDSISSLPKESIEALLIGYHNLAEEYYKRWNDCNAELTKVKETNKVLGEIVKKRLIIDTD